MPSTSSTTRSSTPWPTTSSSQALDNNTIVNLPYDASGNLVRTNGFGAVTSVRSPRVLQLLARFQF